MRRNRMIAKAVGIGLVMALMLPAAAFAASKANGTAGQDKAVIKAERQADRAEIKAQRQADKEVIKNMTPAERKVLRTEKRAAVKEKVRLHRIEKLQAIKARKETNGSDNTPAYQKIIDRLSKLLGIG